MKLSLLLGVLFFFIILPSRAQETHLLSGKDSPAVESRFFFPHNWIRGYTDFDVAPSHRTWVAAYFPSLAMPAALTLAVPPMLAISLVDTSKFSPSAGLSLVILSCSSSLSFLLAETSRR